VKDEKLLQFWSEKARRKGPLGRPRRRWKIAIKVDVKDKGLEGVYWINLAQDCDNCWAV
jgi:hypothetical protein